MRPEEPPPIDLLDVAQQAVALQSVAVDVLARAAASADGAPGLAREGGRAASGLHRLRWYLRDIPWTPDHDELDRLLYHHQQTVEQALALAFATTPCRAATRERFAGLGEPGQRLRDLRDRLAYDAAPL